MTLDEAKQEILSRIDIAAECAARKVEFTSSRPRSSGWQPCLAVGRDDKKPSAAVCTAGSAGELGRYVDKGGDDGNEKHLSFWDLMVELGAFPNWKAAFDYFAEKVGITSREGNRPKDERTVLEQIKLCSEEDSAPAIRRWAQAKPPITEVAIVAAHGRLAIWPKYAPDHARKSVVVIPALRPGRDEPAEAVLFMEDGANFPAAKDYGLEERKVHIVRDKSIARGDCLIVVGGWPALAAAEVIWITEGPTDCLALAGVLPLGQIAISNTHGASEFGDELVPVTSGKKVRIVGDADTAGVSGAKLRASKVVCVATETRIISLPYPILPKHGKDLRDYLLDHTFDDLAKLVDAAPVLSAADVPPPRQRKQKSSEEEDSDLRLPAKDADPAMEAEDFLLTTCRDDVFCLRYWHDGFWNWNAGRYEEIADSEVVARVVLRLNNMYFGVTTSVVGNHMQQVKAQSILPFAQHPPCWLMPVDGAENWNPADVLVTQGHIIHLPSLAAGLPHIQPASPRLFTPVALDFDFDPNATAPTAWLEFLHQIWADDTESIETLQEWFGYCLTADTRQQKILLLIGPKRSGKGTIARILQSLVGKANVAGPTLASLATQFGLQPLIGKTLAIISDARLGPKTDQSIVMERLLAISGEDTLTMDCKFKSALTAKLLVRLMLLRTSCPASLTRAVLWPDALSLSGKRGRSTDGRTGS